MLNQSKDDQQYLRLCQLGKLEVWVGEESLCVIGFKGKGFFCVCVCTYNMVMPVYILKLLFVS